MASIKDIILPDIGGASNVDVIDILVKPGDTVAKEDTLLTLEGDKATMDIPAPYAGKIKEIKVKKGDKVSQNSLIMTIETDAPATTAKAANTSNTSAQTPTTQPSPAATETTTEVRIPDLGNANKVDVLEVLVKVGDTINKDDSLITLEGDKATMDIPSPYSGKVKELKIKKGDKVSQNEVILLIETTQEGSAKPATQAQTNPAPTAALAQPAVIHTPSAAQNSFIAIPDDVHAGPAVRRIAREFGVDLTQVKGSGPKDRILKTDLQTYVKGQLASIRSGNATGLAFAPAPIIDFAKYGPIETKALNKIKKLTGANVHRSWVTIPHVTQFGETDITELEEFRKQQKDVAEKAGVKLTPLVFIMKAVVAALKALPAFNSSLDASGENLILKQYYHIGVAVDTPNGLVVPVVRDVDKKGLFELAKELAAISAKARDKGLSMAEMEGSTFTISSLGGIGGTAFTPIVKSPDVGILGVSKAAIKPIYKDNQFVPRLMLPLSLSYDHRVIDGAEGARFMVFLENYLADIRSLLL